MLRQDTSYFTTAADTAEHSVTTSWIDSYRVMHIKAIRSNVTAATVKLRLKLNGKDKGIFDCAQFAAGNPTPMIEFDLPSNQTLGVFVTDLTGTGRTNMSLTLIYEVDQDV